MPGRIFDITGPYEAMNLREYWSIILTRTGKIFREEENRGKEGPLATDEYLF
jgi:hypothetical protein